MNNETPLAGAAGNELAQKSHQWWCEAAEKSGIDLSALDLTAPFEQRVAWALSLGMAIATVLSRFSSKLQHSTESQVQECIAFAARNGMYVPPELICVDEGQKGRRQRRDGLERTKYILKHRLATVLLVFKVSRLLRNGYKGAEFINENVVEEGLRAIGVSQGIDTSDEKTWKGLMYVHGMMDDMLLDTIADHCRAGLNSLFLAGYVTGALPVGYIGVEVPGAPKTNRGLPRRKPGVDERHRSFIAQHFDWIAGGMPIREGWRRWVKAGGPRDPRSTSKHMSYKSYRQMLSNPRYIGKWAFGRMRNRWSSKRDYTVQVEQPEAEVKILQCEELRIVQDEPFLKVQAILKKNTQGRRGPGREKSAHLWDLTTECFYCAACSTDQNLVRFYQTGAGGQGMGCKNMDLCPCHSAVRRKAAVLAVCESLQKQILRDEEFVVKTVAAAAELDRQADPADVEECRRLQRKIDGVSTKLADWRDLVGQGSDQDRAEVKAKIRSLQADRVTLQAELAAVQSQLQGRSNLLTPDQARQVLTNSRELLEKAGAGELGADAVYEAYAIFRRLVGEKIMVHVEHRPGRKQTVVRGVFRVHLLQTMGANAGQRLTGEDSAQQVDVWLRKPPRVDLLADLAHQLIDIEGLSFRDAAAKLQAEGHKVNSGNLWYSYRRWYEMRGLPVPNRPYNNGRPRESA